MVQTPQTRLPRGPLLGTLEPEGPGVGRGPSREGRGLSLGEAVETLGWGALPTPGHASAALSHHRDLSRSVVLKKQQAGLHA